MAHNKKELWIPEVRVFARNMKRCRVERNMTQLDVAKGSGVDLATINQLENAGLSSDRDPRLSSLSGVARALGVSLSELFTPQPTSQDSNEPPSYLTFSEWFWAKLQMCLRLLNAGRVFSDEPSLRRIFEDMLVVAQSDKKFTEQQRELIWNDRPKISRGNIPSGETKDKSEHDSKGNVEV
jgi:transcriptional regulator with XRE-family HTH domain